MKYVIPNKILSIIILLLNVYFLPNTFEKLFTDDNPFGLNSLFLLITIPINLFLITAYLVFIERFKNSKILLFINGFGVFFGLICFLSIVF